ncbi:MAG: hypothetical protein AAF984_11310 [Verrucomicrobiota bacterium]
MSDIYSQAPGIFTPRNNTPTQPAQPVQQPVDSSPAKKSDGKIDMGGNSSFLGKDVPVMDFGTDVVSWDGKNWNVNNQRVFRARFEKYLNAPAQTNREEVEYQEVLRQIISLVSPQNLTSSNIDDQIDKAWGLLPKASRYKIDANLCDALANAIYSKWLVDKSEHRLEKANASLKHESETVRWNASMAADYGVDLKTAPKDKTAAQLWKQQIKDQREIKLQPHLTRLAELEALMKANNAKKEASEIQSKLMMQGLLVQFFVQRRFQHVVIGSRFYRVIFGDGDTRIELGKEGKKMVGDYSGAPPTLSILESLANEAMRDIEEGVEAYNFLMEKSEMQSAAERLAESFIIGEYMPSIRSLPRDDKRKALTFVQNTNQLLSALEVKDYTRAESIVKELEVMAQDFDPSKPMAAIETARTVSRMHLSKAQNAAVSGQMDVVEQELKNATEIWPRNPELAEVSSKLFSRADVQQQALNDLDRLVAQKNYRQIFDDKVRYIAATALFPDKQELLKEILDQMTLVEGAIIRAQEVAKRGDYAGAWESVERAFSQYPADTKLNQVRADLTTQAAGFVNSLRTAQRHEEKNHVGSSLAWYLEAQRRYPMSEYASEGIKRMVDKILPHEEGKLNEFAEASKESFQ